jgi:hypothetical protein
LASPYDSNGPAAPLPISPSARMVDSILSFTNSRIYSSDLRLVPRITRSEFEASSKHSWLSPLVLSS